MYHCGTRKRKVCRPQFQRTQRASGLRPSRRSLPRGLHGPDRELDRYHALARTSATSATSTLSQRAERAAIYSSLRHGQCEAAPGTSLHSAILRAHRQRAWTESRMCAAVNGCGPDRPPRLPPTQCGGGHRIPSHGRRADRHSRRAPSLRHVLTHRAAAAALRRGQGSRRSASSRAAPRTSRASRRAHRRGQVV